MKKKTQYTAKRLISWLQTKELILLGSPPRFFMASLIEAKSTRAGTPVASLSTQPN